VGRWFAVGLALVAGCSFDRSGGGSSRDGAPPAASDGAPGGDDAGGDRDSGGDCTTGALDFSPDQWVEVADPTLDLTDDFAVEAWVLPRAVDGEYHIVSRHDDGASEGYVLLIKSRLPQFWVYFPDDQGPASRCACSQAGEEVAPGAWVHLAASYADGTSYLYRDGVPIAICDCRDVCGDSCALASHDGPMAIGIEAGRLDRHGVDGAIDDVHLLGRAVTSAFDPLEAGACTADSLLLFHFEAPVGQALTSDCGAAASGQLGSAPAPDDNDPSPVDLACPPG
jgi:hypothetical protein